MTALHRSDIIGSALTAGAVACLEKPIKPEEVLALIARAGGNTADRVCAISGCGERAVVRGFCRSHADKRREFERAGRLPEVWVEKSARSRG